MPVFAIACVFFLVITFFITKFLVMVFQVKFIPAVTVFNLVHFDLFND
jgi:hypothetical protein